MGPKPVDERSDHDLFRTELVNLIDHRHELVKLDELIDWRAFADEWSTQSMPGNPYDGDTADSQIEQIEILSGVTPKIALVDRGYRGVEPAAGTRLLVSHTRRLPKRLKKLLKRRQPGENLRDNRGHVTATLALEGKAELTCGFAFRVLLDGQQAAPDMPVKRASR